MASTAFARTADMCSRRSAHPRAGGGTIPSMRQDASVPRSGETAHVAAHDERASTSTANPAASSDRTRQPEDLLNTGMDLCTAPPAPPQGYHRLVRLRVQVSRRPAGATAGRARPARTAEACPSAASDSRRPAQGTRATSRCARRAPGPTRMSTSTAPRMGCVASDLSPPRSRRARNAQSDLFPGRVGQE